MHKQSYYGELGVYLLPKMPEVFGGQIMKIPTKLIKTEWPNESLKAGNERFDAIYESIKAEGIKEPITIDLNWRVMQGNHRVAVARSLGIEQIEVEVWTGTEMVS